MNLPEQLKQKYSKELVVKLVAEIGDDSFKFQQLITLFFTSIGNARLQSYTSWIVSTCVENFPYLLLPYMGQTIEMMHQPIPETTKRNIIRAWQFIAMEEQYQGQVLTICFDFLQKNNTSIACKIYSLTVAANLAKQIPELRHELKLIIEDQLPYQTPGFVSRGKKILTHFKKSNY